MYSVCLCVYVYLCRSVCVYCVCIHTCVAACVQCLCVNMSVYVCVYVYMCTHMCLCVCVCSGRFGKRNVRRPDVSGSDEETVSTLYILCSQHYLGFLTLGRAGEEHVRRLPVKVREAESGNISESARGRCQARTGILLPPSGGSFCRAVCPPHQHRGETHRPVPSYQQPSSSGVFPSQTSHIPAFSECDPESRR